jgi:tryptophan synthase alpha chain
VTNRIDECFARLAEQRRAALIPFLTAGDPKPEWTVDVLHALVTAGADLVEIGVPFSDPTADGPVIQAASERAIENGVNLHGVLEMVRQFRETDAVTPVVLMGYLNPIERYGYGGFSRDAGAAGVDGILMVDCPPEEMALLRDELDAGGIYPICLVAPTTTEARMDAIAEQAAGYIYYVSFKGITGANRLDASSLSQPIETLRSHCELPVAIGFGIKGPESAAAVADLADGVVIGSALVESLKDAESREQVCERASSFLAPVREAMDNTRL